MPADWTTFLRAEGARLEAGQVLDFGQPEREAELALTANTITDLSFLAVLKITGTDAAAFLHGQFTSEVQQLAENDSQMGAWCNPKGQVIANFILARRNSDYFLLLPRELKDRVLKRLRMFVLRASVTIEDCGESLPCLGINSAGDSDGPALPRHADQLLIPVPVNHSRWVLAGPAAALIQSWPQLARSYAGVGSHYWRLFDILDGLPWILEATTEAFLPQLLNMDQLQAVSFSKGCFPGQEVIARLQHRGKVKQRLVIMKLNADTNVKPGMHIYQDDRDQSVGTIVNTAEHPHGGWYSLAVLDIEHGSPDQLRLKGNSARFIEIIPPPYLTAP